MENMHDDVKDILERLKEQAESTNADNDRTNLSSTV